MRKLLRSLTQQERLNFLLTNRIPRRYMTMLMGWYSKIESPWLTRFSIAIWRMFTDDLDLSEAKKQRYNSLHECFIRELKDGSRPINSAPDTVVSPCDAIIGACGKIEGTTVYQAKDFPYELSDLIPDKTLQQKYCNGFFVTLRLKSSMYHRFHAPIDCKIQEITYISGDTWNVNPVALKRIEKLYCKNERAVIELMLQHNYHSKNDIKQYVTQGAPSITLVPVAAILVASMKFHCLDKQLDINYRGPNRLSCQVSYHKGDEIGYFQHGSTIIVFSDQKFRLWECIQEGKRIKMGEPLLKYAS